MITRGVTDQASAPSSPAPRADDAPPGSDPHAAVSAVAAADIVDVTGAEETWTSAPARHTADPAPLCTSKRASAKPVTGAALAAARKGKKEMARRPAAAASGTTPGRLASEGGQAAESDAEDNPAAPPTKKARKSPAAAKARADEVTPTSERAAAATRADEGFDLGTFMAAFEPGAAAAPTKTATASAVATPAEPDTLAQLHLLQAEVGRLRVMLSNQAPAQAPISTRLVSRPAPVAATTPNAKGEMPPSEICFLTASSFPEGEKKAKGDYNPPQAHLLAASRMFRSFGTDTGKPLSAMSFVLSMRELDCVKFITTPAVLMAIFSGRLRSRGLTLMHFKESTEMATLEDGSSHANFASDFSPTAGLPPASVRCTSYEDILDAVHGLNSLAQEVWYDHMRKLTSRLRAFVAKNKSADPANTPARVRLTLLYANKFIGAALGHIQADDSRWWSGSATPCARSTTSRQRGQWRCSACSHKRMKGTSSSQQETDAATTKEAATVGGVLLSRIGSVA
ncbi:hypothetical protein PHYPSEUDO_014549 [Phytophthora pseudosyringae]|uniref:Uncharacterized protein n=1 Tax=Phytophthora pseudosyringae TaxID=221518 RepID=A0A8T1W548_9STRA|nr:hypothetical protein PHYPSEUDO_014549 [Phytophthora pseudosyringae]